MKGAGARMAPARQRLVVAGPRLLQEALPALLAAQPDVDVTAATSVAAVVTVARRTAPDVVVMLLGPRDAGEGQAVRGLKRLRPAPRVVLMTSWAPPERLAELVVAGADACIATDGGCEELLRALAAVREGRRFLSACAADALVHGWERAAAPPREGGRLSPREREILGFIATGQTEREIGRQLGLSPRTVHAHRTSVMKKLGAHNSISLVRRAVHLGLVEL